MLLDLKALTDYGNWIGETAWDVHGSVMRVGGWQQVFPGALPRWASRIRQYFNLTPMTLELLDHEESSRCLEMVQTALPSARVEAVRNALRLEPGREIGTILALSGSVYEDALGRSIWFQMSPGGAIYHFGEKIRSPTLRSIEATYEGQEQAPVFKLVCLDGTGGSREVCIKNPFDVRKIRTEVGGALSTTMVGHATIGAVNEEVNVADRIVK